MEPEERVLDDFDDDPIINPTDIPSIVTKSQKKKEKKIKRKKKKQVIIIFILS